MLAPTRASQTNSRSKYNAGRHRVMRHARYRSTSFYVKLHPALPQVHDRDVVHQWRVHFSRCQIWGTSATRVLLVETKTGCLDEQERQPQSQNN